MRAWLLAGLAAWTFVSPAASITRPFLYEVRSPEGKVSHLFGTVHVGIGLSDLPASVGASLSAARVALFEKLPSPPEPAASPVNDTLKVRLLEIDVPEKALGSIRDADCFAAAIARPAWSSKALDQDLLNLAGEKKVPVRGLESAETRAQAESLTPECLLSELSRKPGGLRKWAVDFDVALGRLLNRYESGDPGTEFTSDEESMRYRNFRWLPALTAELDRGEAFVAVGVSHLFGYAGLIELLKDRGYRVTRVQ